MKSRLLTITTCASLDEPSDISVPVQASKETSLPAVFPYHNIKLLRIVQDELVVCLRCEVFVKVAWKPR